MVYYNKPDKLTECQHIFFKLKLYNCTANENSICATKMKILVYSQITNAFYRTAFESRLLCCCW